MSVVFGTRRTDDRDLLPGTCREADVLHQNLIGEIPETDVLEGEPPLCPIQNNRRIRIGHLLFVIEEPERTLCGRKRRLQRIDRSHAVR